jgi:hypothetical protein
MSILHRWIFPRLLIRSHNHVYAVAGQGIGNRLKHLASAWSAAAFHGHTVRAWWLRDAGLDCEWERLFGSVPIDLREGAPPLTVGNLKPGSWLWLPEGETYPDASEYPDRHFGGNCVGRPGTGATRLTIAREIPAEIRNRYRAIFAMFRPHVEILRHVDKLSSELGLGECIGVHVRKTDMEQGMRQHFPHGSPYDDDAYFAFIDAHTAYAHEARFFVVSDCRNAMERVRRRYGSRVLTSGDIERGRVGTRAGIDALQDLLLLSKTKHIVAAYKSAFSEMAWWWGNATLEVVGLDAPNPQA